MKKENEALFENRVTFLLNRIRESLQGESLPELMKIDPTDLLPAEFDLVLSVIEECKQLEIRAASWGSKLKERFYDKQI